MPLHILAILLFTVIAAAALTVAVGVYVVGVFSLAPATAVAGLSILALCAAILLRRYTQPHDR